MTIDRTAGAVPRVAAMHPLPCSWPRAARDRHPHDSVVALGLTSIGGGRFAWGLRGAASPDVLAAARAAGAQWLAGDDEAAVRDAGLAHVATLPTASATAHALLLAAGAIDDPARFDAAAATRRPVLLERGIADDVDGWLMAAERLLAAGQDQLVLVETGVLGADPRFARQPDLAAVPLLKARCHLPVLVDAGAAGAPDLIALLALAAAAIGADGIVTPVGPDGLDGPALAMLARELAPIIALKGRTL